MNKTTIQHYQDALSAWENGACNIIALSNELAKLLQDLRESNYPTIEKHPAVQLYLAQMSSLAGIGIGDCNGAEEKARAFITTRLPVHGHTLACSGTVYYWIAGYQHHEEVTAQSRVEAMAYIKSKYPSAINISCHMNDYQQTHKE